MTSRTVASRTEILSNVSCACGIAVPDNPKAHIHAVNTPQRIKTPL